MPRNYVPDAHIVRSALGMAQDKSPAPPINKYSSYPNLLPYALLPIYAGHFGLGLARGEWSGVGEFKDDLIDEPGQVHLLARWLIAIFGALTPIVAFRAARAAGLDEGAWVAAWLVATGLMHVHFSLQERPWVPTVFFTTLAAWPAAIYVRNPGPRSLIYSGLAAGAAAACHQSGLFALAVPGFAWLVSPLGWSGEDLRSRLLQGVKCVAIFFALVLLIGYPSYLLHGLPSNEQTIGGGKADLDFGGQAINFDRRWQTFPHLARAFFGYGPVLTILGILGFARFLRQRVALPAGLFALGWAAFFMTHQNDHVRYLLPLAVLGALPAGSAVELAWRRGGVLRVLVLVLLAVPLALSLRLGSVIVQDDTRAQAETMMASLDPAAFVAIDRHGPRPELDRASLEELQSIRQATGSSLYTREARRLERMLAGGPDGGVHGLFVEDLFEIDERSQEVSVRKGLEDLYGKTPEAVFDHLGFTHLLIVDRLAGSGEEHFWSEFVGGRGPLDSATPYPAGMAGGEARLPMELEFPLASLWRLERPGPWLGLYDLR